jgi:DNA-binding XRE family transcriptional regulator
MNERFLKKNPNGAPRDARAEIWTSQQREQLREIARKTLTERPTEAEMDASSKYVGPMPFGVFQDLLLAMIELKKAREALGLSLADVSERTGIDRGSISKMENGLANPTFETIGRYAAGLGKRVGIVLEDLAPVEQGNANSHAES